jgi:hypothetical protein
MPPEECPKGPFQAMTQIRATLPDQLVARRLAGKIRSGIKQTTRDSPRQCIYFAKRVLKESSLEAGGAEASQHRNKARLGSARKRRAGKNRDGRSCLLQEGGGSCLTLWQGSFPGDAYANREV